MSALLPVSIVIPTIGRVELLRTSLESILECAPGAAEIVVVDQSRDKHVRELVDSLVTTNAQVVSCHKRGVGAGINLGMRLASNEVVLVTHDDCTVPRSWVGVAWRLLQGDLAQIVTGRVLPAGDERAVPSTKKDPNPRDYTGSIENGALFPNNMALGRAELLAFGGFDERFEFAVSEDNDLSYRWLRAGFRLRYEPQLFVWHHEWRTHAELERLYISYWWALGFFYAKHLRRGDATMVRFILEDMHSGLRGIAAAVVHRRPRWTDWRRGILRGLPAGLVHGWRVFRS